MQFVTTSVTVIAKLYVFGPQEEKSKVSVEFDVVDGDTQPGILVQLKFDPGLAPLTEMIDDKTGSEVQMNGLEAVMVGTG